MKGSADRDAGHSRLPRSARGSPGAAIAGTAIRRAVAVRRTPFIEHLRTPAPQSRCQRLFRRSALSRSPATPVVQPSGQLSLQASFSGSIVPPTPQGVRQVFLIDPGVRSVMRVLIALAIAEVLHEPGLRVPDM